MSSLEIKNLHVAIGGKEIVKGSVVTHDSRIVDEQVAEAIGA